MNSLKTISLISILINIGLAVLKFLVGFFTHSIVLIAGAVDSLLDIFSSLITFLGIRAGQKPADREHPYGHERYESLASLIIVIILFLSAGWILFEAIKNILGNQTVAQFSFWGIVVMAAAVVINETMARVKFYFGNKFSSLALVADGEHTRADAFASVAILGGLFLIKFYPSADSVLAILVALYIFYQAYFLGKETVDSLVDTANPELEEKIKKILQEDNIDFLNIKTRKIGASNFAEIALLFSSKAEIDEVTLLTKNLEEKLLHQLPELKQISLAVKSHDFVDRAIRPRFGKHFHFQRGLEKIGPEKQGKRIVIPLENDEIALRFGAPEYLIIDLDKNNQVIQKSKIKNPYFEATGAGHGTKLAKSVGADKIITKHLGENAKKNLEAQGIEIEIVDQNKKLKDIDFLKD